jgi:hypothetical protein
MDYWGYSLKEAMGYVNDHASSGAVIVVPLATPVGEYYARSDLIVERLPNPQAEYEIVINKPSDYVEHAIR